MNIRVLFGYLFFALSLFLGIVQLFVFPNSERLNENALLLIFLFTVAALGLGLLALETRHRTGCRISAVACFLMTFALIACSALLTLSNSAMMTSMKYALFFAYIVAYSSAGIAFSIFAAAKPAPAETSGPA